MTVSLPKDLVEHLDAFLDDYGSILGYRGRGEFLATAVRELRRREELRVMRLASLSRGREEGLEWDELEG